MSVSLNVKGYSSRDNKEFQKHYNAVVFCINSKLSFPKETSEFFKGKIGGSNLEDISPEYILEYIENGVEMKIPIKYENYKAFISVKEIPEGCDLIIAEIC